MSDYCNGSGQSSVDIFAEKDPDATTDFQFNWSSWLDGDEIDSTDFLLPDGLTEVSSSNTTTTATVFVSGGRRGGVYRITNRISTVGGRTQDKTIYIRIADQ
jgi:hypothetical protein